MDSENSKWNMKEIISDNTLYKCKKRMSCKYTQCACKWKGTLEEYIQHIKNQHSASYFLFSNKPQKFQWKLPYVGDQTDLGIFEHEMGHFLYEIYFKENPGKLYFSLTNLNKLSDNYRPFYNLLFNNNNNINEASFMRQVNNEISDISKPVHKQKQTVILDQDVIAKFIDQNRAFQWYITIVIKQTSIN